MSTKQLYTLSKNIAKMYDVPLYIAWQYKYFPNDIRYIKKYGLDK